jgi:hypothetical protein
MSTADSAVNVPGTGSVPVDVSLGFDATSGASVNRQRMLLGDDLNFGQLAPVSYLDPRPIDPALYTILTQGSPDLVEIKELLAKLLEATLAQQSPFISDVPFVDRGRQHVMAFPPRATPINISGTITTGGTAQLLFSATNVRGFDLQNQSAAQALGFSWWTTLPVIGNANTYQLSLGSPGGYYATPPTLGIFDQLTVYVIGGTTAQAFTGSYW